MAGAGDTSVLEPAREDTKDECITVRATVRGPVRGHRNAREVSGRAVARSEHLGEARVSTVYTDTASVRTTSRVWENRVPNRRLPTPCADVGNFEANFRPEAPRALGARPMVASAPQSRALYGSHARRAPTRSRVWVGFGTTRVVPHSVSGAGRRDVMLEVIVARSTDYSYAW